MMAKLAAYVSVHDLEHGTVTFGPEDEVPAWAVDLITNPKAWEESAAEPVEESEESDDSEAGAETVEETEADEAEESAAEPGIPPVKGPGSSAKAWAAYAIAQGFEVDGDAKASEIREALAEAGIPIE